MSTKAEPSLTEFYTFFDGVCKGCDFMSKEYDKENLCPWCGERLTELECGAHVCPFCGWEEGEDEPSRDL